MRRHRMAIIFPLIGICYLFAIPSNAFILPGVWSAEFENGFNVVLIEDHSSPMIASVVCIRAGSRTESLSDNGISHLLEHLLFSGTNRQNRETLKKTVESNGGYFNAFTRKDYVAFEIVMPKLKADLGLELQSEQLFQSVIPDAELEKEKKVVCEEIAKDLNDVASFADDHLMKRMMGHSGYGLPVIGNYDTVSNITKEEILRFYRTRYVPNQMTAVVIGDFSPDMMIQKLRALYEKIPAGLSPQSIERSIQIADSDQPEIIMAAVANDNLFFAAAAPPLADPSFSNFDLAIELWGGSDDSTLSKMLSESNPPLASNVSAYIDPFAGFSFLKIAVTPSENYPDSKEVLYQRIRSKILESLAVFISEGVSDEFFERIRMRRLTDFQFGREKFHHLAREICHYNALSAANAYFNIPGSLEVTSASTVIRSLKAFLPENPLDTPLAGVFVLAESDSAVKKSNPPSREPVMTTFENGLRVIAQMDAFAPVMTYHLLTPAFQSPSATITRLTSEMLDKGTARHAAIEISNLLGSNGIRIKLADEAWLPFDDYYYSPEYAYIRMESLSKSSEIACQLLAEMAFESIFPENEFERLKQKITQLIKQRAKKPSDLTRDQLESILFPGSIFDSPLLTDEPGLAAISIDQIREYYHQTYAPDNCILSIVGDLPPDRMIEQARKYFGDFASRETPAIQALKPTASPETRRINSPSETGYIRGAIPVFASIDNFAELEIVASILSDSLQNAIREQKGMGYRLGASISYRKGTAVLQIGVETRKQNIKEVESIINSTISDLRKNRIAKNEITDKANALAGEAIRYRQPRVNRAYYLGWSEFLGFGYQMEKNFENRYAEATSEGVSLVIKDCIPEPGAWFWTIAE